MTTAGQLQREGVTDTGTGASEENRGSALVVTERLRYHADIMPARLTSALTRVKPSAIATRALFERLAGGPLPSWERLEAEIVVQRIEAGGTVFTQDAEHPFAYVVRSGLLKNVYFSEDGEDWIKSFCEEGQFFGSVAALESHGRTSFAAMAVEASEVERLPYMMLEKLAETNVAWANVLRKALLIFGRRKEKRERELLTLRPEERYRAFVAETPGLEDRIPQRDLARYLGLTPVGLNRIVRRVKRG
jgi:CRP-like cAMP-binding protein